VNLVEEDLVAKERNFDNSDPDRLHKRLSAGAYRAQRRGGKGVIGMATKEEDEIEHLIDATTTTQFFSSPIRAVFSD